MHQATIYKKEKTLFLRQKANKTTKKPACTLSLNGVCTADTHPRASLCEDAGSVCVIRTVRGVGGGDVSHLMVALSSRPSSSTAAIWGVKAQKGSLEVTLGSEGTTHCITAPWMSLITSHSVSTISAVCTFLLCFLRSLGCWAEKRCWSISTQRVSCCSSRTTLIKMIIHH